MAASNAAMTVWQDVIPHSRAESRGAQAIANVRRAAHVHAFSVDGTDWVVLARVYQRAVGAAPWWRLSSALALLLTGMAAFLVVNEALSSFIAHRMPTEPIRLPFASGALGVVESMAFTVAVTVMWAGWVLGPVRLLCTCAKRMARKTPAWTERPLPPALAIAETCGQLLTAPGDEQQPLLDRLDRQLEVLLSDLWRAAGHGMGLTRHPSHRKAMTQHLRRVEAALRATQGRLFSEPDAARTLGRQSLTIATRLATPRVTQLLDAYDLPPAAGQDRREGRRLAAVTALGLAISSTVVSGLLHLHVLPDGLAPWIFGVAFVCVFLSVFGQRSSARPLAVLRQRLAELGTPAAPSPGAPGEGADHGAPHGSPGS